MAAGPRASQPNLPESLAHDVLQAFLLGKLPLSEHEQLVARAQLGTVDLATAGDFDDSSDALVVALRNPTPDSLAPASSARLQQAIDRVLRELSAAEKAPGEPAEELPFERIGEYRLIRRLGQGGMGAVYLAEHQRLGREFAIKLLPAAINSDPDAARRFEREIRTVGRLDHPHIVRATDAGEVDGQLFLVMEYVDGQNLHQIVRERGPLPARVAVQFIHDAAAALDHAHRHGVIHRDVKPANLMVDRSGRVKLLDLGLARFRVQEESARSAELSRQLTRDGAVMGTIDYMAPEQAADTKDADELSDIYSLSCTLFYLLTGTAPYPHGTVVQRIVAHRDAPIPKVTERRPDLPVAVDALLSRWMAKRPDERPRSMVQAIEQLDALLKSANLPEAEPVVIDSGKIREWELAASTANGAPRTSPTVLTPSTRVMIPPHAQPLLIGVGLAVVIMLGVFACLSFLIRVDEPWGRGAKTTNTQSTVTSATLDTSVSPPARQPRPLDFGNGGGTVNLLQWLDLTKDVDKGNIRFKGRTLWISHNSRLSVRATNPLPDRVRLVLDIGRVPDTDGALRLVFRYHQTVFGLILDAPAEVPGHRTCGINPFPRDGLFQQRDLARSRPLIPADGMALITIDLLNDGLSATIDDEVVYEWRGDFDALTGKLPPAGFPVLLIDTWADAEQFLVRRAELIDLDQSPASTREGNAL